MFQISIIFLIFFSQIDEKHEKEFSISEEETGKTYSFYELKTLKSGNSFGQLALIENKARIASIVCKEDCHFALLEKMHFDCILSKKNHQ